MALFQVGELILRSPAGEFLPDPTPIYKEIPDEHINTETGLTKRDERACQEISKMLAHKFKQYADGCKAAGLEV